MPKPLFVCVSIILYNNRNAYYKSQTKATSHTHFIYNHRPCIYINIKYNKSTLKSHTIETIRCATYNPNRCVSTIYYLYILYTIYISREYYNTYTFVRERDAFIYIDCLSRSRLCFIFSSATNHNYIKIAQRQRAKCNNTR